jgi:uncharacterized membrane protein YphA (DoxX/SURF4 family)
MLNPFPTLLSLSFFAPTILRITLGIYLLYFGLRKLTKSRKLESDLLERIGFRPGIYFAVGCGLVEIIAAIFLILGFLTQIAALIAALITISGAWLKIKSPTLRSENLSSYLLILAIAVSLLALGAGAFAIDLPL